VGDFEGCEDILTCDWTPQKVTIEPIILHTGYFTSDNEPGGMENATHNTGKAGYLSPPCPGLRSNVLWVAFSIPPGSLSFVKYVV
jgi:hypothetical protein